MADWSKTKPSKNFIDKTTNPVGDWLAELLRPWSPQDLNANEQDPYTFHDWSPEERKRLGKGEDALNLLRERMKNAFMFNFINGKNTPGNFNFHQEQFPNDSNLRKRSKGSAYDNY
jgi:hypothetical protein